MSRPTFARGRSSATRKAAPAESPMIMRGRWRDLAELARQSARAAVDRPLELFDSAQLSNLLIRTGAVDIPAEGESARKLRRAFVEACGAMLLAGPERRALCAGVAEAAAKAVLAVLDLETAKAARPWQKQFND